MIASLWIAPTVSVALARELAGLHAERGVGYVAAPVFGRPDVAAAGQLTTAAAGETKHIDAVQPLLDKLGQKTRRFGAAPERANAVKLAMNFMIGCAIEATAEASALAEAHGVAASDFLEMASTTLLAAPVYKIYGRLIAEQRFSPAGMKLALGLKDLRLVAQAADAALTPMPFASAKVAMRRAGRS